MAHQPENHRRLRSGVRTYIPRFRSLQGRQGRRDAYRCHYGYLSAYRAAVFRNMVPGADDMALCVAGIDGGRLLLPHFGDDILHHDIQSCGTAAVGSLHRIFVGGGHSARVDSSQEYRASARRYRVEDLHLAQAGVGRPTWLVRWPARFAAMKVGILAIAKNPDSV